MQRKLAKSVWVFQELLVQENVWDRYSTVRRRRRVPQPWPSLTSISNHHMPFTRLITIRWDCFQRYFTTAFNTFRRDLTFWPFIQSTFHSWHREIRRNKYRGRVNIKKKSSQLLFIQSNISIYGFYRKYSLFFLSCNFLTIFRKKCEKFIM